MDQNNSLNFGEMKLDLNDQPFLFTINFRFIDRYVLFDYFLKNYVNFIKIRVIKQNLKK